MRRQSICWILELFLFVFFSVVAVWRSSAFDGNVMMTALHTFLVPQCYRVNDCSGENWFVAFSSAGHWSERTRAHAPMCEFVIFLRMVSVFHLRVRARPHYSWSCRKCFPSKQQIAARDRLVRAMAVIIDVLFAFGVDLPSTPTQPWHNVFTSFSTWSIIIFNHCTVSAYYV